MTDSFIPGLALSERFYWEAVEPILTATSSELSHTAALIGPGSEVLGFDTPMSTDHDWGPRLLLFLNEVDFDHQADTIQVALATKLPRNFLGHSTHFTQPDPDDGGTQVMEKTNDGPINHRVALYTIRSYFQEYLGYNTELPLEVTDWLTISEQHLRSITAGAVFHDDLGLSQLRDRFGYYPHDLWLYLLACGWARIGQEEHLMGRAGIAGDEIGSALVASRLVCDIMRLCFLMERTYAPYPKWFGTAFRQLTCADTFIPHLEGVQTAGNWQNRQRHLIPAYEALARMHNRLGITAPISEEVCDFFGRPFKVIAVHGFGDALLAEIRDPSVRQIAQHRPIGNIDQFSDSTDLLTDASWRPILKGLYSKSIGDEVDS